MTHADQRFVVVGGGLAGARAVETLRAEGFEGSLVLVSAERHLPYERPPLSKAVLAGRDDVAVATLHDRSWYAERNVELRLTTTATNLDTAGRNLTLDDGSQIAYDALLLATGSSARRLEIPGSELEGVRYLRTIDDSLALLERFRSQPRVVIVGAGWIGLETASGAREHGAEVTMIETAAQPLQMVVGEQLGRVFADLHRDHGVDLILSGGVSSFEGDGQIDAVVLADGRRLPADLVVVGVGAQPNLELARKAGLDIDRGVVTDAALRTSDQYVFAAGDIVQWPHPILSEQIRVEHWANANDSGVAAAKSMLGHDVAYDALPFFFSDQYDIGLEYVGYAAPDVDPELVIRGDPASREFMAFWLRDGRLLAAMHMNMWDSLEPVHPLIASRKTLDSKRLTDLSIAIGS
ncbi:MAG: FAD-dependent oxidoreductase [Actinomycetota bacterium]|nr:FAD-dependent oxidoreductase [Actinomycetota bacterium]